MRRSRLAFAAVSIIFLMTLCFIPALAQVSLPDGAVKGLPEGMTAMDSAGKIVDSASGEYFFQVEDMKFGEVYTKDVQLMNLRSDEAYNIYFYVEPLPESKKGEIDLEEGCTCSFFLDGVEFYRGSISGVGNIDLTKEVKDLGYYEPGDTHTLSCSIAWVNDVGSYYIDEGHKLVDKSGTWFLTPKNGDSSIEGEIEFKWLFYAVTDEDYVPPMTGVFAADGTVWLICIAICAVLVGIMFILLALKKKKRKKKAS